MVTVEVDPVRVESRLAAGEIAYPCRGGVLGGWGHGSARTIARLADPVSAAAGPLPECAVTRVLLPVTVFSRRARSRVARSSGPHEQRHAGGHAVQFGVVLAAALALFA